MTKSKNQPTPKNQAIADRFAKSALVYESHARLQQEIATTLATCLPSDTPDKILEIGSGTGLLTKHILENYPAIPFTITDLTPEMISICMKKFHHMPGVKFAVLDAETIEAPNTYDLIASSMTVHWFSNMRAGIKNIQSSLTKNGNFFYSTIGKNCFPEWRNALNQLGLNIGIRDVPELPGIFHRETLSITYQSPLDFLKSLSCVGAQTPRKDYAPLTRRQLLSAMDQLDKTSGSKVTWEILYGKIGRK